MGGAKCGAESSKDATGTDACLFLMVSDHLVNTNLCFSKEERKGVGVVQRVCYTLYPSEFLLDSIVVCDEGVLVEVLGLIFVLFCFGLKFWSLLQVSRTSFLKKKI